MSTGDFLRCTGRCGTAKRSKRPWMLRSLAEFSRDLPENPADANLRFVSGTGSQSRGLSLQRWATRQSICWAQLATTVLNAKGSYLLQWTWIQWLKENGVRWYDLGGIDPDGNPGVYHFKKGFSGADVCQLTPFVACENAFSFAVVKAGRVMDRAVRRLSNLQGGLVAKSAI